MTYNDIELCVNVNESSLRIDDGQRRDPPLDELFERDDDRRVGGGCFYVFIGADPQLSQSFVHERWPRHIVYLHIEKQQTIIFKLDQIQIWGQANHIPLLT